MGIVQRARRFIGNVHYIGCKDNQKNWITYNLREKINLNPNPNSNLNPNLNPNLNVNLNPNPNLNRKRIRFDVLTRIPKVGTFAYSF